MPLPAALAARLAKRGLIKTSSAQAEEVEEVIAEDYDDMRQSHPFLPNDLGQDGTTVDIDAEDLVHECLACPNRSNLYHACTEYCKKRWGFKRFKPDPELAKKHERLLVKHPLPPGWAEVGDPETGRYYYWNVETDEVSWLPPQHPRANISLSAERLKELTRMANETHTDERDSQGESSADESTDLDDEDDLDDVKGLDEPVRSDRRQDRGRKRQRETLDPMDPAAYSDVPRGTWSTGLDLRGSAKTGVDVTVSGPLFQQRPYPSPGAVLRMNKESTKNKELPKPKEATVKK